MARIIDLSGLFGGEPLDPEKRKELQRQELRERANVERVLREALPHIQSARAALRELNRLGFDHPNTTDVRHKLALMADDVQAYLERPPPSEE